MYNLFIFKIQHFFDRQGPICQFYKQNKQMLNELKELPYYLENHRLVIEKEGNIGREVMHLLRLN